ncbi:MAG TPA: PAS domain S-box protein [Candidatus Didemnitutus sp.]|nr:PAS domain S-box protein [Candidatus Didemnitutus sp.]
MAPATAIGLLLSGWAVRSATGLNGTGRLRPSAWRRRAVLFCAEAVILLGIVHLAALALGREASLYWLTGKMGLQSHRMSAMTALDFILFGTALWLAVRNSRVGLQHALGLAVYLTACLGLCRYIYGGRPLAPIADMAAHTAASFAGLGVAVVVLRPDAGIPALLTSSGTGSGPLRRYLALALLAPFGVAGLLAATGPVAEAGLSVLAAASAALAFCFVWLLALRQERDSVAHSHLVAIVNSSDDAIIGKTLDGIITTWNAGAERIFGYAAAEIIGQPMMRLIPPDRAAEEPQILSRIARGEHVEHFETERVRKDGRRIAVAVTISPVLDYAGRTVGASKIARDITAFKRAEQELRESQERFAVMFNKAALPAILSRFPSFQIVDANEAWLRLFGRTKEEIVGQTSDTLGYHREPGQRESLIADITRLRSIRDREVTLLDRSGREVTLLINVDLLAIAGTEYSLTTALDITARKKAEAALRLSESVVRDAGRMAHVGGWCFNPATGEGTWTEEVARIHDLSPDAPASVSRGLSHYVGESRQKIEAAVKAVVECGAPYDLELEFLSAVGRRKWVRTIGEPVIEEGRVVMVRGAFQDITEQHRAEESRIRMAEIVEGMTEACFALDADWKLTFLNELGRELLEPTQAEAVGRSFWEPFAHLLGTPLEERCRRAMRDRTPETFELRLPGSGRWFDFRLFPSGSGLAGFMLDIHARKEAEASLRMFRELMDRTSEGIEVVDPQTARLLDVNEAACRQLGYTREECLRLTVFEINPVLTKEKFDEIGVQLREAGSVLIEQTHRHKNGTDFPVELSINRVTIDRDYLVALVRDITDRQRAERALRESEEKFRQVVENIHEVFWIADAQSREVLYVSPAYERIWGHAVTDPKVVSRAWIESVVPEDRDRVIEAILTRQTAGTYDETYRILRPDGATRWIHDIAYAVRDEKGVVRRIVGVAEDVTEQKNLETQFLRAQRLEAVGTLAGGIAHDLNNILAPMLIVAPALREKLTDPHDAAMIDMIEKGTLRGASIIRQLLTFSRGIEGERGPVQVKHLVREMAAIMQETFPREIEIRSNVAAQLWPVIADATQLHQVVLNLCVNARDAMPNGGKLSLSAQNAVVERGDIAQHPGAPPGSYVLVTVTDTGEGIPPENLARIFEPFFTTKAVGKGTGLGLSTVLGIVKSHGGFVTVYSEVGRGTVFKVYLPADQSSAAMATSAPPAAPRGYQELILVVDDELAIRSSLQRVLEQHNYRVLAAENGAEAMRQLLHHQDAIKLLFTDLMMPGMTGLDLIRAARQLNPRLKVVVATGLHDRERQEELSALGIHEALSKPFTPLAVLEAIRFQLRQHPSP